MKPAIDMVLARRYRLVRRVGRGQIGDVWAAAHLERRHWVAVEIIHPELHRDAPMLERLRESATMSSRVLDPGLRAAIDFADDPKLGPFMVMELLEGSSLEQLMADRGVLTPANAAWVVAETTRIVERMHGRGKAHGNLTAAQVFVERTPQHDAPGVRLLAPGLSRYAAASTMRTTLVPRGGTPSSLSPEQLEDGDPSPPVDTWALGSLLYELIVGHAPFARPTAVQTIQAIARADPPVLPPGTPDAISWAVLHCLRRDPAQRPLLPLVRGALERISAPFPRQWIDAYRLDLGPPPFPPGQPAAAAPFGVDLTARRDGDLATAPTLLVDRGTPEDT